MDAEQRRIRGNEARQLLDNPLLKDAFGAVGEYLEQQALSCEPDNQERAQRIIISKQLLAAIRREIARVVEDGNVAEIQIAEIERRKGVRRFLR